MKNDEYIIFINRYREWYKKIGEVYSPALGVRVRFRSNGFRHLIYNGIGHRRNQKDIFRRLNLLAQTVENISKCQNIHYYKNEGQTQYWTLERNMTVVVLRKIGNGAIHFYSVWRRK